MPAQKTPEFVSLAGLSRVADIPYEKCVRALRAGKFQPDATAGPMFLFRRDRAGDLRAIILGPRFRQSPLPLG